MTKTKKAKTKKAKVEEIKEDEKVKKHKPLYSVYTKINGIVNEVETDDIASAILASRPAFPKTPLTVRITKGKKTLDFYIQLQPAKRLYQNKITMKMFIKNLIF